MAAAQQAFHCLWQTDAIREILFEHLSKEDICNVRRTSSACCNLVTKRLFKRTHLTFTASSFTRQSRVQALSRIGHHIEHLTFHFPHSEATFLPPLVHPDSGREISFLYKPHTSIASVLERPKFANSGLGHILTEQYPPLFHAASNVPAFIHAIKHLVNLRHLTIRTPYQDPKERYRRDIVDYALISLRIAIERAPITRLSKLSLISVHPAAFIYLSHLPGGFGSLPSASRRWRQIRKMNISVEAWDFYSASPGLDHLKMMEDYIRSFSASLDKLTFTWLGLKGPCPLSLASDPLFAPARNTQKLFHEVTSPMSPLPPAPARKPVVLAKARYLAVRNATMNERQVADLVSAHQLNVREFDFENVVLINAGSWDTALAPLLEHPCTNDNWSRHSSATIGETLESIHSVHHDDRLPSRADLSGHSAAVAALSRELIDMSFGFGQDEYEDDQLTIAPEFDSDLEAARQASMLGPSLLKKRRVTKRRRRRKDTHERVTEDEAESKDIFQRIKATTAEVKGLTREHSLFRRYRQRKAADSIDETPELPETPSPKPRFARHNTADSISSLPSEPPSFTTPNSPPQARLFGEVESVRSYSPSARLFGEVTRDSLLGSEPDLYNSHTDAESLPDDPFRPETPDTLSGHSMTISSPILSTLPSMPILLQPAVYDPTAELCQEISAVQRDLEAEEAHRAYAEDVEMQTSALKRAKELVLSRLANPALTTQQQYNNNNNNNNNNVAFGGPLYSGGRDSRKDSLGSSGFLSSARFRDGLFRRGSPIPQGLRHFSGHHDHRSMDVPILFSRA